MKRFSRVECSDAADGGRRRCPGTPACRRPNPARGQAASGILPAAGACPCGRLRQPC